LKQSTNRAGLRHLTNVTASQCLLFRFELACQPAGYQRKSYPHENRGLRPTPLAIQFKSHEPDTNQVQGIVAVFLGNYQLSVVHSADGPLTVTEYGSELVVNEGYSEVCQAQGA
jgi:hypothetical protein